MPAIHEEIESAIAYLDYSNSNLETEIEIHILIDFDPQTFRQGYGNFKSVEDLINGGFEVKCLKDNRISFIISDDIGYYLFIESRSLIPADKKTINAVKIDPISIVRLKKFFFNDSIKIDFQDELTNAIIEESKQLKDADNQLPKQKAPVNEILDKNIKSVEKDLKQNPPLQPDFKRIVEYYSNKFQYVELHFEGQNFNHYSISIPPRLLPYKNKELRKKLITKLKLFENITKNEDFEPFEEIIAKKKSISKKFITNIKCRRGKGIIKKTDKISFEKELNLLSGRLQSFKNKMYNSMQKEIEMSKEGLINTLTPFLIDNPTDEMKFWPSEDLPSIAKNISTNLVNKINIPDPTKWINGFHIETNYSDITYEDLTDKALLDELKEKQILIDEDDTNLAVFGKAIKLI